MKRIHHLPPSLASKIASIFILNSTERADIDVARPFRFFNTKQYSVSPTQTIFPLDVSRYVTLQEFKALEPVEDVTYGMGEMIGRTHRGYDARDRVCDGRG